MGSATKVTLYQTSGRDMENSTGKMVGSMMECGRMANNMAEALLLRRMDKNGLESGTKAGRQSGLLDIDRCKSMVLALRIKKAKLLIFLN